MDWAYTVAPERRRERRMLSSHFTFVVFAFSVVTFFSIMIIFLFDHIDLIYALGRNNSFGRAAIGAAGGDQVASSSSLRILRTEMGQNFQHVDSMLRIINAELAARRSGNGAVPIAADISSWEDFRWEDFKSAQLPQMWKDFKDTHQKSYDSDEEEERMQIFFDNYKRIIEHNRLYIIGERSYELRMNHFGDLKPEEFRRMMNGFVRPKGVANRKGRRTFEPLGGDYTLPALVDWRKSGYVTPVKDQKHCGSCWAFSATGALEGQHMRKYGKLVSLSEQNLIDCSQKYGNKGCNGGLMDQAFEYIKNNGGVDTEQSYPYEAKEGRCRFKNSTIGASDIGYKDIPEGNETLLMQAVATVGPVSVAIDASHESFQFYHDGVYLERSCSTQELNHGVLAVGYGTMGGRDYWIVKNSWSENWGNRGYILMARNKRNMCGIASSASYPVV